MKTLHFDLMKKLFPGRLGIAEHRQVQILQTALAMIQKDGFENLQFGDLAKRCKVSRTLIHHYFSDKFALANRLLDLSTLLLQTFVDDALAREKDTRLHLEVYCKATLDWVTHHPQEATGLLLYLHLASTNENMRKRNDELSALGRQKIQYYLSHKKTSHIHFEQKAQAIQTILTGCYLRLLSENLTLQESDNLRASCVSICRSVAVSI